MRYMGVYRVWGVGSPKIGGVLLRVPVLRSPYLRDGHIGSLWGFCRVEKGLGFPGVV